MKRFKFVFLTIIIVLISYQAFSGVEITSEIKSDSYMGTGKLKKIQKISIIPGWVRVNGKKKIIIYNGRANILYVIFPEDKDYMMANWKELDRIFKKTKKHLKNIAAYIRKTGKRIRVSSWITDLWKGSISSKVFKTKINYYIASSILIPDVWRKYLLQISRMQGGIGIWGESGKKFLRIKGYPVKTEMKITMFGREYKSIVKVINIKYKKIPFSIFKIPHGYTKILFDMARFQKD